MRPTLAVCLLSAVLPLCALAQAPAPAQPDKTIDAAMRSEVLAGAADALDKSYVFADVGAKMAAAVRAREKAGDYGAITSAQEYARTLTAHLQEICRDKHVRVMYGAPGAMAIAAATSPAARTEALRAINYGFEKAERLAGNIGYLDLRSFQGSGPEADEAADNAMTQLAGADALIIDLRRNGGGNPQMVARVSSYLFDQPTHLNSFYSRDSDRTLESWTTKDVRGTRYGQAKPVFVLTSARTFSAAEEFSYNLKNLKRATLVGATTGGGAHPGRVRRINQDFSVFVPSGRAINPITKTNWEGVGVIPDVAVPADQALDKALELASAAARKG